MVIGELSVTGDHTGARRWSERRLIAPVTGGERDDGAGFRQDLLGIDPFETVAGEIAHFAVAALVEPLLEFGGSERRGRGRDAAIIEPEIPCLANDLLFHGGGVAAHTDRNWWTTWVATSRAERNSVLTRTSAWR